jgi:DNA-binding MarR family transcriptional regulator
MPMAEAEPRDLNPDEVARLYFEACSWAGLEALEVNLWLIAANQALLSGVQRTINAVAPRTSPARYVALRDLFLSPANLLSQHELQRGSRVTSGTMTRLIDGLEEDELVRRVPSSEDRRSIFVELAPEGLELCRQLIPAVARYSVEVCEGMSVADQKRFVKLLKSIAGKSEAARGLE